MTYAYIHTLPRKMKGPWALPARPLGGEDLVEARVVREAAGNSSGEEAGPRGSVLGPYWNYYEES